MVVELRSALHSRGMKPDDYAGHSFRIGGGNNGGKEGNSGLPYSDAGQMEEHSLHVIRSRCSRDVTKCN